MGTQSSCDGYCNSSCIPACTLTPHHVLLGPPPSLPTPHPPHAPAQALKAAFTALMTCDAAKVAGAISSLMARLNQEAQGDRQLSDKEQLVLRLNTQYPSDVGVLSAFFLNQVTLLAWVPQRVVIHSC